MLNAIAVIGRIGTTELLLILAVVLVIFGPKHLPKLAETFGKTINSFKKGVTDGLEDGKKEEPKAEAPAEAPAEKTEE